MDHYPEVNVSERQCSSRSDSNASSINKAGQHHNTKMNSSQLAAPQYESFPPPDDAVEKRLDRNDSANSVSVTHDDDAKLHHLEAECNEYMDAPPPYSKKQYEGKSEDEQNKMRMADYAKELKRMMGRQLVKGLKTGGSDTSKSP